MSDSNWEKPEDFFMQFTKVITPLKQLLMYLDKLKWIILRERSERIIEMGDNLDDHK